jgi:CRISPR-associated exonuclease Cas4
MAWPTDLGLALLLLVIALALGAWGLARVAALRRDETVGRLVAVDASSTSGRTLRSPRYRIAGRPDELRVDAAGRWIPVEWKSRSAPRAGPAYSHRIQVYAYCLLCEETTGRPPPFGVLRYGDGTEFRLPWDAGARAELLRLRAAFGQRYDGRATPSPGKCAGCRWRNGCDRRAA